MTLLRHLAAGLTLLALLVLPASISATSATAATPRPTTKQAEGGGGYQVPPGVTSVLNTQGRQMSRVVGPIVNAFVSEIRSQYSELASIDSSIDTVAELETQAPLITSRWNRACGQASQQLNVLYKGCEEWTDNNDNIVLRWMESLMDDVDRTKELLSALGPMVTMKIMTNVISKQAENAETVVEAVDGLVEQANNALEYIEPFFESGPSGMDEEERGWIYEACLDLVRLLRLIRGTAKGVGDYLDDEPFGELDAASGIESLSNVGGYTEINGIGSLTTDFMQQLLAAQTAINEARDGYAEAWGPITDKTMLNKYPKFKEVFDGELIIADSFLSRIRTEAERFRDGTRPGRGE